MADKLLEVVDQTAKNWTGEGRGPQQVVDEFHLYGHTARAAALDQIDEHLRRLGSVEGEADIRDYTRLTSMRRSLGKVHSTLIKVGR
jgi:hypothetical protein